MIKPMKAYVCDPQNLPGKGWIAEEKFDGYRMTMTIKDGKVTCQSYTGKDITDKLPQFQFCINEDAPNAILDGELVPQSGAFKDLKSIIGAKAPKAIAWQDEHGFAIFRVFDMTSVFYENIENRPLYERKDMLFWYIDHCLEKSHIIEPVLSYCLRGEDTGARRYKWYNEIDSFEELRDTMWANGKEGLMFKKLCGTYEQKRSKNVLKLKESHTFDVVIMGYTEPTKEFEGKTDLDKWPYWVNEPTTWPLNPNHMVAVTKPYYMGWPGAVEFGVWKTMDWNNDLQLVKIGECRGFSDAELEYIKNNKENLLGAVIEVRAQRLENPTIGSIRHPQFNRWRPDKPAYECTWENHIEAGK